MRKIAFTLIAAGAVLATEASAQVIVRASAVPPGQRPPDGMCRVWIEGVAPGRQPQATDCVTAQATAPLNSRIIYGGDGPFPGRAVGRFDDARVLGERARRDDGTLTGVLGGRSDRVRRDRDDDDGDDRRISKAERNRIRALEKARRDREKQLSKAEKERERALRKAQKEREKELKKAQKEREKELKRAQKEREKALKRARRNDDRGRRGRGNGRDG